VVANDADRALIEPVIFSKTVDYRRDVKRRKIAADAATDELLRKYKPEHVKRKRKK
jgi:hypothetical protein